MLALARAVRGPPCRALVPTESASVSFPFQSALGEYVSAATACCEIDSLAEKEIVLPLTTVALARASGSIPCTNIPSSVGRESDP